SQSAARVGGAERFANLEQIGGSGRAKHQGHAVEEKRGGERSQQKVLERRFATGGGAAAISGENVGRDRRDFQSDEDQDQLDRRRHQHHSHRAEQDQPEVLTAADVLSLQVLE